MSNKHPEIAIKQEITRFKGQLDKPDAPLATPWEHGYVAGLEMAQRIVTGGE